MRATKKQSGLVARLIRQLPAAPVSRRASAGLVLLAEVALLLALALGGLGANLLEVLLERGKVLASL